MLWAPSFNQTNDLPRALSVRRPTNTGQRRGFFSEDDMRNTRTTVVIAAGAVLAAWGTDPGGPPDLDGDGVVGIVDFLLLLANWGQCP